MKAGLVLAKRMSLVAIGWMAIAAVAQGQDAVPGTKSPAYDVVSVKPTRSVDDMTRITSSADRFKASGVTIKQLIGYAYDIKMDDQISGSLGSISESRFDIDAKLDDEALTAQKKLSLAGVAEQRRLMTQVMLADRFKLQLHHETKELPIYALVVAKGGFKLKAADPTNTYPNGIKGPDGLSRPGMMTMRDGVITAQAVPISNLVTVLSQRLHRIVMDKTGLTGKYDLVLQWVPDDNPAGQDNGTETNSGPSLFAALQEQLGLKLESTKGPVDTVVVDHVEAPSEN